MTKLEQLQSACTLKEFAQLLRIPPRHLSYQIYINEKKYITFDIPKKKGGLRTILAPNEHLKNIQKKLSDYLYDCIDEINNSKKQTFHLSHGYRRNHSIVHNAKAHVNKKYVLNIDLKDYYNFINFGRVRGFFIKNQNFTLSETVATVIAQIACYENSLPQGSPCSPVISNLIGHLLDIRLSKLAKNNRCTYTRYCDDITFSTGLKQFPKAIAYTDNNSSWVLNKTLRRIVTDVGFVINEDKVRMQYYQSRQTVTGLSVNRRYNTKREYRQLTRAMVHRLTRTGEFDTPKTENKNNQHSLQGMLAYIKHIDNIFEFEHKSNESSFSDSTSSRNKTLKEFLIYTNFFAADKVVVIGEGKTDKVHFKLYLKNRFPHLHNYVDFWNSETALSDVITKSGGIGDLSALAGNYDKFCKNYYVVERQNPCLIILDNDDGCRKFSFRSRKGAPPYTRIYTQASDEGDKAGVYFVSHNLYVIVINKLNQKDTCIEDYYNSSVLQLEFHGKTFNKENSKNVNTYGKQIFATRVVPHNTALVDWRKFDNIFRYALCAIRDFQSRVP